MDQMKLATVVRELLTERFPEAGISDVHIKSDVDGDGDKVLRITVVLEPGQEHLNQERLVSFVRYLRPKLAQVDSEEFPLLSFVKKSEAVRLKLEPA